MALHAECLVLLSTLGKPNVFADVYILVPYAALINHESFENMQRLLRILRFCHLVNISPQEIEKVQ